MCRSVKMQQEHWRRDLLFQMRMGGLDVGKLFQISDKEVLHPRVRYFMGQAFNADLLEQRDRNGADAGDGQIDHDPLGG